MTNIIWRLQFALTFVYLSLIVRTASQASDPTITPPPNFAPIHQRQGTDEPDFLGYSSLTNGFYSARRCSGSETYFSWSRWAGCVTETADLNIECTNGSVIIWPAAPSGGGTCEENYRNCGAALIYNHPTDTSALSMIRCFNGTERPTYYRQTMESTTTTTLVTTTAPNPISRTGSGPTSSSISSSTPTYSPAPNLAWVAGPAIGGVALIVIVGLLFWIGVLLRKRHSNSEAPQIENIQVEPTGDKPVNQVPLSSMSSTYVPTQPSRVVSSNPSERYVSPPYEMGYVIHEGPAIPGYGHEPWRRPEGQ